MLLPIIPEYQKRRRPLRRRRAPAPEGPTLVAAIYEPGILVELRFDRTVNIDDVVASRIVVEDGQYDQSRYIGTTANRGFDGMSVWFDLVAEGEELPPGDVILNAPDNTGIVAEETGGAWQGVTGLVLPFN